MAFPRPFATGQPGTALPILVVVWLTQLALAGVLGRLDPGAVRPLLIERRACTTGQWADLVQRYRPLYRQHQLGQQRLDPVIHYGVFGEQRLSQPPTPAELATAVGVGAKQRGRGGELRRRFPEALVLQCAAE